MSLNACAELVERGDPDRFLAAMAAPPAAREVLFPLYAFNLEVARAPWVASEPMIAEMRLQFWRDVAEEIGQGKPPRAHEVVAPLSDVVSPDTADLLDGLIAARRWDVYREPFEDAEHFDSYIDATSGHLVWVGAMALGAPDASEGAVRDMAYGAGVAALFRAVPDLEARGRLPLLDGRPEAVRALAEAALSRFRRGKAGQGAVPRTARPALYALWRTEATLRAALKDPTRVADGRLDESEFARRGRLLRVSVTGRL